jgi:hypothetical protein
MEKKLFTMFMMVLLAMTSVVVCGCSDDDEVSAVYHLLNKNGDEARVFNQGDEIIFELIITNSKEYSLKIGDVREFAKGAFIVYGSEGQIFNPKPSDNYIWNPVTIESGKQFVHQLKWPWNSVSLPSGKYYSICTFDIEELSNKVYTVNFEIK